MTSARGAETAVIAINLVHDTEKAHLLDYVAMAAVPLRLFWRPCRVRSWLHRAASVDVAMAGLSALAVTELPPRAGHNLRGLWMVWLIWLLMLLLGLTAHALLANLLLAPVIAHLGGVSVMSLIWKENLTVAIVTRG